MKKYLLLLFLFCSLLAVAQPRNSHNGHEYVDLGLSVKWATCNVGAPSPDVYGSYFAWGEVYPKDYYGWSEYRWWEKGEGFFGNYMTKYCFNSVDGNVDYRAILSSSDDVASVRWGGNWRMPTKDELFELRDRCVWQETTLNDVRGYRITGPNGNSIFIPNAAYIIGSIYGDKHDRIFLWSSSLNRNESDEAYLLDSYELTISYDRYIGCPVRPVLP